MMRTLAAPGRFFRDHPLAYALSLAGAFSATSFAAAAAAREGDPAVKRRYALLAVVCGVEGLGIITARRLAAGGRVV